MKKTISVQIPYIVTIYTEPRPRAVRGLRPEYLGGLYDMGAIYEWACESFHGFLDAPEMIQCGYCAKYESGGEFRVYDVVQPRCSW